MAKDRWDMGRIDAGPSFAAGFVTPWNVRSFSEYDEMQLLPSMKKPATMAEQMDGDQNVDWGGSGKKR